jgi:hypothetical protein
MATQLTIADIVCNTLDKEYSLDQAATDFGELKNKRELIKRRYGADSTRLTDLAKIIPIFHGRLSTHVQSN